MSRLPAERRLCLLLRTLGTLDLLALTAVLAPREWLFQTHAWLGLGEFPDLPAPIYLARMTSLLYGFQGMIFWHLARDVERYRPLIAWWGKLTLGGAILFLAIDISAGLPWQWCTIEPICVAAIGLSLLWAERQLAPELALSRFETKKSMTKRRPSKAAASGRR